MPGEGCLGWTALTQSDVLAMVPPSGAGNCVGPNPIKGAGWYGQEQTTSTTASDQRRGEKAEEAADRRCAGRE